MRVKVKPSKEPSRPVLKVATIGVVALTIGCAAWNRSLLLDNSSGLNDILPLSGGQQQQGLETAASRLLLPSPEVSGYTIEKQWTGDSIPTALKVDSSALAAATTPVTVKIPGFQNHYEVHFFAKTPPWLSHRTFATEIFFCPPNGHEGTITHLIGQLLSQGDGNGHFMDVGSNLGFYSLLAIDMGFHAYAFDIQPMCLFNLLALARSAKKSDKLHLFNVGMSDRELVVTNAEGGCDYENFYVANETQRVDKVLDATKAGIGEKVPVVRMDYWMQFNTQLMMNGNKHIQVLKMDTEGAEGRIVLGMQKTLASCMIRNWIVELTPAHWYRFDQKMDDPAAIQAFIDVVEVHNYKAYFMYMQTPRLPPPSHHDYMKPLDQHPTVPGETGTGCDSKYYEILDMKRFFFDYCLGFADTVPRDKHSTCKGFCGNIWFRKQGCSGDV